MMTDLLVLKSELLQQQQIFHLNEVVAIRKTE